MKRTLLIINAGSSSIKFMLFGLTPDLPYMGKGKVVEIGGPSMFDAVRADGSHNVEKALPVGTTTHEKALDVILEWIEQSKQEGEEISAVAHRVLHGSTRYSAPIRLDKDNIAFLDSLCPLGPLHQPHNLSCIKLMAQKNGDMPQFGCFDTAFHTTQDPLQSTFPLPKKYRDLGMMRYGFHGLSYDWISQQLQKDHPHLYAGRVVVAHLGNGASLCAMKGGKSMGTTMGMTAVDGLPMGTRTGSFDAGAVFYMQRSLGMSIDDVEKVLYKESGLKGLSGITSDCRVLSSSDDPNAKFALEYFAMKVAQNIASMAVAIGGLDGLVFCGGIGENAPNVRAMVLERLAFLPKFETHVIPTNEERGMAQRIFNLFSKDLGVA